MTAATGLGQQRWAVAALVATLAVPAAALLPDSSAVLVGIKLLPATFAVAFIPGLLVTLVSGASAGLSPLGLIAVGLALTFPMIQLLTMASLLLHLSASTILVILLLTNLALAGWLWKKGRQDAGTTAWSDYEYALAAGLLLIGARLFLHGSPVATWEDSIHISVARRLLVLDEPSLLNAYIIPDFVYTYPFPGQHFTITLISAASGLDPVLAYHKLRFLWGPGAILFVYAAARVLFPEPRLAFASAWLGVLFVLSGSFADVPGYYWAQLAPFTHISDLSMNYLLPGSLLLLLSFLAADLPGARNVFFIATVLHASALLMVHPREAVQFAVYAAAFGGVALLRKWSRRAGLRALTALAAVVVIGLTYNYWHSHAIWHVAELESEFRAGARKFIASMPVSDYFRNPNEITFPYFSGNQLFFLGWNWLLLLLGPIVVMAWPRSIASLFVAASVLGYAAILRFPIVGLSYAATTYDEILVSPVRNVVFFIYLLGGAALYLLVAQIMRVRWKVLGVLGVAAAGVVLYYLWKHGAPWFATRTAGFLLTVFVGYAIAVLWLLFSARPIVAHRNAMTMFLLLSGGLAYLTAVPNGSVLRPATSTSTEREVIEALGCKPNACAPPVAFAEWAREQLPTDTVFILNVDNEVFPSLLAPQQMVAWPGPGIGNHLNRNNFPVFYRHYDRAVNELKAKPFYNELEDLETRIGFARDLRATHVLVDPAVHDMMTRVLGQWPNVFKPVYDADRWSVYEISAPAVP